MALKRVEVIVWLVTGMCTSCGEIKTVSMNRVDSGQGAILPHRCVDGAWREATVNDVTPALLGVEVQDV